MWAGLPRCAVVIMASNVASIFRIGVGQEICDAGEGLILFRVKHMKDSAYQEGVARLFPVIALFQGTSGSTSTSAMFWTSRTSHSPRRTSSSGL